MKNEDNIPAWLLTIAHLGGILFVLTVLGVLVYIFWDIAQGALEDRHAKKQIKKEMEDWEEHLKKVEEAQNDFSS